MSGPTLVEAASPGPRAPGAPGPTSAQGAPEVERGSREDVARRAPTIGGPDAPPDDQCHSESEREPQQEPEDRECDHVVTLP